MAALTQRAEKKRREIMEAAWKVFSLHGYERASVDAIAAECGASKATIYVYFSSKEELFVQASIERAKLIGEQFFLGFFSNASIGEDLYAFGLQYLAEYVSSDLTEIYRLASAEGKKLSFGVLLYESCFRPCWNSVANYLEKRLDPAVLFAGGGWTAAMHLRGLLDGDVLMRRAWGVDGPVDPEWAKGRAAAAVTAFLRIYAPDEAALFAWNITQS